MIKIFIFCSVVFLAGIPDHAFAQKGNFTIMGVMKHSDLEGGCWFMESKHMKYELTGSPEILATCHVQGRMLFLRVREAPMMASTCMLGHMVQVIEVLDTVFHPHNPPYKKMMIKGTIRRNNDSCWYVLGKDKKRYELQMPIPSQFLKIGKRYHRISTVLPNTESQCNMDAVITISMLDPDLKPKEAKEKKFDPR